jgi:histidine triad (HIT) family protein
VIYEDESAIAFLDINPRVAGHTVVIPKYHSATLVDLPDDLVSKLFIAVKKVDQILLEKLNPDGMTIGINQGRASGQEVDHIHIHLMPRFKNDGGGSIQSVVNNKPKDDINDIFSKLKS